MQSPLLTSILILIAGYTLAQNSDGSICIPCYIDPGSTAYKKVVVQDAYCSEVNWDAMCNTLYANYGGSLPDIPLCIDFCPELNQLKGSPCDDGDESTYGDTVTDSCTCEGKVPMPNQGPCTAITLICDNEITGYTTGALGDSIGFCGTADDAAGGVWYKFPSLIDGVLALHTFGSGYDTKLRVYSGECNNLVCIDGVDDSKSNLENDLFSSELLIPVETNVDYFILVHGYKHYEGVFKLSVKCVDFECPALGAMIGDPCAYNQDGYIGGIVDDNCSCVGVPVQSNDDPCEAIDIACGSSITGTTAGKAPSIETFCGIASSQSGAAWYRYFATESVNVIVSTCGSAFDTQLLVFKGSCNDLQCVGGNDDSNTGSGLYHYSASLKWKAVAGNYYYIMIQGYTDQEGLYTLSVNCEPTDCTESSQNFNETCLAGDTIGIVSEVCNCDTSSYAGCTLGSMYGTANPSCELQPIQKVPNAWANEFTLVSLDSNQTYIFSVADQYIPGYAYYITLADALTDSILTAGISKVEWTTDSDHAVKFYSHIEPNCNPYSSGYQTAHSRVIETVCPMEYACPILLLNIGSNCEVEGIPGIVDIDCNCITAPVCNVNGGTVSTFGPTNNLCIGDGFPNLIQLNVSGQTTPGLFGIVNAQTLNIVQVNFSGSFNFENLAPGSYLVGYLAYEDINQLLGVTNINQITGCFDFSNAIPVNSVQLSGGTITSNSAAEVCNGIVSVSADGQVGTSFQYVLLNESGTQVLQTNQQGLFNFTSRSEGVYRIVHIAFNGNAQLNPSNTSLPQNCLAVSNVLTFVKVNCPSATLMASPNPLNESTTISFTLPGNTVARIALYDMSGRLIKSLFTGIASADEVHQVIMNAHELPNGVYVLKLVTGQETVQQKIIMSR